MSTRKIIAARYENKPPFTKEELNAAGSEFEMRPSPEVEAKIEALIRILRESRRNGGSN